jgi:hypothetical protein
MDWICHTFVIWILNLQITIFQFRYITVITNEKRIKDIHKLSLFSKKKAAMLLRCCYYYLSSETLEYNLRCPSFVGPSDCPAFITKLNEASNLDYFIYKPKPHMWLVMCVRAIILLSYTFWYFFFGSTERRPQPPFHMRVHPGSRIINSFLIWNIEN